MEDAGIYEDVKNDYGVKAPSAVGSVSASRLGGLIVRAIEKDLPDVLVTRAPVRVSAAMQALAPRLFESISARTNTVEIFREVARAHVAERERERERERA